MRLLEEMGRVVARVRELLAGQGVAQAARELEQVAQQAGVSLQLVRVLGGESLSGILSTAGKPDPLKLLLAAEYLYVQGLREEPPRSAELFARALDLYRNVGPIAAAPLVAAVADRIADLEQRLAQLDPSLLWRTSS